MTDYEVVVNLWNYDQDWTEDEDVLQVADVGDDATQNQASVNCEVKLCVWSVMATSVHNL
jgi:hypothetical protein